LTAASTACRSASQPPQCRFHDLDAVSRAVCSRGGRWLVAPPPPALPPPTPCRPLCSRGGRWLAAPLPPTPCCPLVPKAAAPGSRTIAPRRPNPTPTVSTTSSPLSFPPIPNCAKSDFASAGFVCLDLQRTEELLPVRSTCSCWRTQQEH
jgi:hypothetical protein